MGYLCTTLEETRSLRKLGIPGSQCCVQTNTIWPTQLPI